MQLIVILQMKWSDLEKKLSDPNREFSEQHSKARHDAARVTDFPAAPPPLRIGEQEVQLQPSNHTRSAPPLDAADLGWTAVTPLALKIELLLFPFFWPTYLHLRAPLSSRYHGVIGRPGGGLRASAGEISE